MNDNTKAQLVIVITIAVIVSTLTIGTLYSNNLVLKRRIVKADYQVEELGFKSRHYESEFREICDEYNQTLYATGGMYGYTVSRDNPTNTYESEQFVSDTQFYSLDPLRTKEKDGDIVIKNKSYVFISGALYDGSQLKIINCTHILIQFSIFKNVDTAINIINSRGIIIEYFAINNVTNGIVLENCSNILLGGQTRVCDDDEIVYNSFINNYRNEAIMTPGCDNVTVIGIDASEKDSPGWTK